MTYVRLLAAGCILVCGVANGAGSSAGLPALVSAPDLSTTIAGLLAVLAFMAGCVWLLKRVGMVKTGAGAVGKIVGGVSVGNRERVVVVEIGDQWIVVGVAPGRVSPLAQLPRQEQIDTTAAPAMPNFANWLKKAYEKRSTNAVR